MPLRNQKRSRETDEAGANDEPDTKKRAVSSDVVSMFDNKPKVGMRLDARDVDYIWSPATLTKVHKNKVTVHYDGWDKTYDETRKWNSTDNRLAPLHSFSKEVKCLVDLLPKKKESPTESELESLPAVAPEVYSNLWPCKVQFRMPHPLVEGANDQEDCVNAQAFLAGENNIFIQPFGLNYLPHHVQHSLKENDGKWIKVKRVKPWRANPLELGVLPENFDKTFRLANEETVGVLLPGAIVEGSLLKEEYLVHNREGAAVRDGALHEEEVDAVESEEAGEEEAELVVEETRSATKAQTWPEGATQQKPSEETKEEKQSPLSSCVIS